MKKLFFLILLVAAQVSIIAQATDNHYSFKVDVKGKGKPIILIPGLASSGEVWNESVNTLEKHHECHILTLPGFAGQQAISVENGFLPKVQKEIIKYIQEELDQKPTLIGHSLGGFLALSIASSETELVSKIIIVDSYPFYSAMYGTQVTEESIKPQAKTMQEQTLAQTDEQFAAQQKMMMPAMISAPSKVEIAVNWSLQTDRPTMTQAMYEIMTTDLRDEVENVTVPILVFGSWYGAKNYGITMEMVDSAYKSQFALAQNCQVKIAKTGLHFIMWDEPTWFIENVTSFLSDAQ